MSNFGCTNVVYGSIGYVVMYLRLFEVLVTCSVFKGVSIRSPLSVPSQVKPSIDCSVHARLYAALPELQAVLHFHGGYVAEDCATSYPYPCGTVEEAEECLAHLDGYGDQSWVLPNPNPASFGHY